MIQTTIIRLIQMPYINYVAEYLILYCIGKSSFAQDVFGWGGSGFNHEGHFKGIQDWLVNL